MPTRTECENCRVSIASLSTKVCGMSDRLDAVEKHQLELIELASFGKGSLRAIVLMGVALGGLAGLAIAVKSWMN